MIFKKFSQGEGMKNEQGNHLIFSVVVFDSGDQTILDKQYWEISEPLVLT